MKHVFISYVREDQKLVDHLAKELKNAGVDLWIDREKIKPGQRWQMAIANAIEEGAFFVACFSRMYETKDRSYMNEELTLAIEELRKRPANRTWFIPVLLDKTSIPHRNIGAGETLRDIQWVDLSENWSVGFQQLANVLLSDLQQDKINQDKNREINVILEDRISAKMVAQALDGLCAFSDAHKIDTIIGINKGGLLVGSYVATKLGLSERNLYRCSVPTGNGEVTCSNELDCTAKNILIVDDVCRTGTTMFRAFASLHNKLKAAKKTFSGVLVAKVAENEPIDKMIDYFAFRSNSPDIRMPWDDEAAGKYTKRESI